VPSFSASLQLPGHLRLPKKSQIPGHLVILFGSFRTFIASAASEAALPIQGSSEKLTYSPGTGPAKSDC